MANRTKVIETLEEYFKKKGRILNAQEYARETDTPIRLQQVRNIFGSWNKVEKLLMAREYNSDQITNVDELIAARNKAAWEATQQWREASENQDKKARREAEAQHVAETLALNAATPEGANANKIAIGGPLPSEQPQLHRTGATVTVDPVTREQTVVDVEPEIVEASVENPRTPAEIKAAVKAESLAKTADVKVGHATDGGSTGKASTATVAALGGDDSSEEDSADAKETNKILTGSAAKTSDKK